MKPSYPTAIPKTPATYRNWVIHGGHRCTIWGVDPGVTDLFVAADGSSTNAHRFRRTSTKEYYDLCGFNLATEKRMEFRRNAPPETIEIIDGIESLKTSNIDTMRHAIQYRMQHFDVISNFFDLDQRFGKLRMQTFKGKQKGIEELARRLTFGSKKYGSSPKPFHEHMLSPFARRRPVWTPLPSCDKPEEGRAHHYIVALGNGAFGKQRGKLPAPVKRLRQHLYKVSRRNVHLSVVIIDEYNTSKACAECHQKTLVKMTRRAWSNQPSNAKSNIHAVLKCTSCSTVWNRDEMAAKNIRFIFEYMAAHNDERPEIFRRPPSNAEEDAGPEEGEGSASAS